MSVKTEQKGYRSLHTWVERRLGKPMICSNCGDTTKKRYEWANISQEYKRELSDWKRLCVLCHKKFDYGVQDNQCFKGHELTADNRYGPTNNWCRTFNRAVHNRNRRWDKSKKGYIRV